MLGEFMEPVIFECPVKNCGNPIDDPGVSFFCENCQTNFGQCGDCKKYIVDHDVETLCDDCDEGEEYVGCPNDQCDNDLPLRVVVESKTFNCDLCGNVYKIDPSSFTDDPDPTPKGKQKRKVNKRTAPNLKHNKSMEAYIKFFLKNNDGVTIEMLKDKFKLKTQAAQYARRCVYRVADDRGYECKVEKIKGTNSKLFTIRKM